MNLPLFVAVWLAFGAVGDPPAVRDSQTCRPARTESWDLFTSKRTSPNTTISSPNWPPVEGTSQLFEGRFTLTVIQRWPVTTDSIRRGTLEIAAGSQARQTGTSDIDFKAWGIPGAAYSAASRDSLRPGVVVARDKQGRVLLTVSGANLEDAGILFAVFRVDSSGFSGMWVSGAAVTRAPKGYFCAFR